MIEKKLNRLLLTFGLNSFLMMNKITKLSLTENIAIKQLDFSAHADFKLSLYF